MANSDEHNRTDIIGDFLAGELGRSLSPVPIDGSRRARMRSAILQHAGQLETEVVRADSGEWRKFLPGIHIKTLRLDREEGTQTSLWRVEPGAHIPPHKHTKDEECLILEGSIEYAGETYSAGDYLYARRGVKQSAFRTTTGALLLIRSELVPRTGPLTRFLYRLFYR